MWLLSAPRWVLVAVSGLPFGLVMALFGRIGQHEPWGVALSGGAIGGVLYGLLMGLLQHRWNAATRAAAGDVSPEGWRQLSRAVRGRAVPAEPAIRAAAVSMLELHRKRIERQRPWGLPFLLLVTALAVWFALSRTPWWWGAAALFTAVIVMNLVVPPRLRRRVERLRAADGAGCP